MPPNYFLQRYTLAPWYKALKGQTVAVTEQNELREVSYLSVPSVPSLALAIQLPHSPSLRKASQMRSTVGKGRERVKRHRNHSGR
jgi:hypothetical protein